MAVTLHGSAVTGTATPVAWVPAYRPTIVTHYQESHDHLGQHISGFPSNLSGGGQYTVYQT